VIGQDGSFLFQGTHTEERCAACLSPPSFLFFPSDHVISKISQNSSFSKRSQEKNLFPPFFSLYEECSEMEGTDKVMEKGGFTFPLLLLLSEEVRGKKTEKVDRFSPSDHESDGKTATSFFPPFFPLPQDSAPEQAANRPFFFPFPPLTSSRRATFPFPGAR